MLGRTAAVFLALVLLLMTACLGGSGSPSTTLEATTTTDSSAQETRPADLDRALALFVEAVREVAPELATQLWKT